MIDDDNEAHNYDVRRKPQRVTRRGQRLHPRYWPADPALLPEAFASLAAAFAAHGQGELASRRALNRKPCPKCLGFGGPWSEVRRLVGEPGRQRAVRDYERRACERCGGRGVL